MRKNNLPAYILDEDGSYPVLKIEEVNNGLALTYNKLGIEQYHYASADYTPYEFEHRILYLKATGNNSAAYLKIQNGKLFIEPCDPNCPGEDWSALLRSHWNTRTVKSLTKKSWLIWAIVAASIVVALIIGVIAWWVISRNLNNNDKEEKANVTGWHVLCRENQTAGIALDYIEF